MHERLNIFRAVGSEAVYHAGSAVFPLLSAGGILLSPAGNY